MPLIGISQIFTEPATLNLIDQEINYSSGTYFPNFGPIGWSKDGIFAYQMIYCSGGCGCCGNYIYVKSAKTDEHIENIDLGSYREWDEVGELDWTQNQREIDRVLLKYNIRNTGFGKFYRNNKVDNFEIILKQRSNNRCDEPEIGTSINYQVLVGNNKVGYKRVTSGEM